MKSYCLVVKNKYVYCGNKSSNNVTFNLMFYNLKITFLKLFRKGGMYSWINIAGLAAGLTACILIMLWMQDELTHIEYI